MSYSTVVLLGIMEGCPKHHDLEGKGVIAVTCSKVKILCHCKLDKEPHGLSKCQSAENGLIVTTCCLLKQYNITSLQKNYIT